MFNSLIKKVPVTVWSALIVISHFLTNSHVYASEEAVVLLMNAYQNSGANPALIRSGAARFKVLVEDSPSVKAMSPVLENIRKQQAEKIKEIFRHNAKQMEAELKRLEEDSKQQSPEVFKKQIEMSILMLGNDFYFAPDGRQTKRRIESKELIPLQGPPQRKDVPPKNTIIQMVSIFMGSPNQPETCVKVKWIPNSQSVEYENTHSNVEEFQLFGRLQELPGSWIGEIFRSKLDRKNFSFPTDSLNHFVSEIEKRGLTCEITGEESYDTTGKAKVVEVKKKEVLLEKYLIDPSRGYICPYLFSVDESGSVSQECSAKNYSKMTELDLFYPSLFVDSFKDPMGESKRTYQLQPKSLVFNQPVSEKEFAIDVPEGGKVYRRIIGKQNSLSPGSPMSIQEITYSAVKPGIISLAQGGYDIDKMQWLEKELPESEYLPPSGGAPNWVRWSLMSVGGLLILYALIRMLLDRIRKKQ